MVVLGRSGTRSLKSSSWTAAVDCALEPLPAMPVGWWSVGAVVEEQPASGGATATSVTIGGSAANQRPTLRSSRSSPAFQVWSQNVDSSFEHPGLQIQTRPPPYSNTQHRHHILCAPWISEHSISPNRFFTMSAEKRPAEGDPSSSQSLVKRQNVRNSDGALARLNASSNALVQSVRVAKSSVISQKLTPLRHLGLAG